MNDTISRQQAIDTVSVACFELRGVFEECEDALKALPSVQPEPQWILCNDRLPEEYEWIGTKKFGTTISDEVYVTFETPDGQRFTKHIRFQNGKLSSSDKRLMEVWYNDAKPIAWMPLPEPYVERRQDGDK